MAPRRVSAPAVVATAVVVLTIVAAVVVIGPPSRQRQHRLDARRVSDLGSLAYAIDEYWNNRKALPLTLDSLVSGHQLDRVPRDPTTTAPYQFTITDPKTFKICATFEQPSDEERDPFGVTYYGGPRSWHHGVGPTCFDLHPIERKN